MRRRTDAPEVPERIIEMTTFIKSALVAAALATTAGLPALADAGSLDAAAARHFNAGVAVADRQTEPGDVTGTTGSIVSLMTRGTAGGDTLDERAALHFNAGVATPDRQTVVAPATGSDALEAFAVEIFNRGVAPADRQPI
jgi:hypothetical protein